VPAKDCSGDDIGRCRFSSQSIPRSPSSLPTADALQTTGRNIARVTGNNERPHRCRRRGQHQHQPSCRNRRHVLSDAPDHDRVKDGGRRPDVVHRIRRSKGARKHHQGPDVNPSGQLPQASFAKKDEQCPTPLVRPRKGDLHPAGPPAQSATIRLKTTPREPGRLKWSKQQKKSRFFLGLALSHTTYAYSGPHRRRPASHTVHLTVRNYSPTRGTESQVDVALPPRGQPPTTKSRSVPAVKMAPGPIETRSPYDEPVCLSSSKQRTSTVDSCFPATKRDGRPLLSGHYAKAAGRLTFIQ